MFTHQKKSMVKLIGKDFLDSKLWNGQTCKEINEEERVSEIQLSVKNWDLGSMSVLKFGLKKSRDALENWEPEMIGRD